MRRLLLILLILTSFWGMLPKHAFATSFSTENAQNDLPIIITQPVPDDASIGEKASVFVHATGKDLRYQWYYRDKGQTEFTKSTVTKSNYTLTVKLSNVDRELYCVITDSNGNEVITDITKLLTPLQEELSIVKQPTPDNATIGEKANVYVQATGKDLKYQWYYRDEGQTDFTKSTVTKSNYTLTVKELNLNRELYCIVTDARGNQVISDIVRLIAISDDILEIVSQPVPASAVIGETATIFVEARGNGLKYQWYYRDAGQTEFTKSTVLKSTYTLTIKETNAKRELYCVITDKNGNQVVTNTIKLLQPEKTQLSIITQPSPDYAAIGEKATVYVKAQGDGLSYQWYYRDEGQAYFTKSSITTSNYTLTVKKINVGRELYCVVTDEKGNQVTTDIVKLLLPLKQKLEIVTQPCSDFAYIAEKATVSVVANGEGLSYQWYYRDSKQLEFTKSTVTKNTYTITIKQSNQNREIYCVITDAHGNQITTDTVKLISKTFAEKKVSILPSTTVNIGDFIEYTITITNNSNQMETVSVTDILPSNTTYISGKAIVSDRNLTWNNVTVEAGESVDLSYIVQVHDDPNLYSNGVISAEYASVNGNRISAYPLYIRKTLNSNDAEYLKYALLALHDSSYKSYTLLKWIYMVAYSENTLITEDPLSVLHTIYSDFDETGNALRATVAPTLYGGTDVPADADQLFLGSRASTISEKNLIVGDVLLLEMDGIAYMYMYYDGLISLNEGIQCCDTDYVLNLLSKSSRYAVIRPSFNFPVVTVSSGLPNTDMMTANQKALYITALNYLLRGERIQYDDSRLSSIANSEFRWMKGAVSPENYTADEWGYTNCAAFCYDLYFYALGFDIKSYTTSGLIGKTAWHAYYYQPTGTVDKNIATEQITKFTSTLTPGDLIVIRRDKDNNGSDDSGHVLLYIGNGKAIHCSGSSYQYTASAETYEPSIRFIDVAAYLFAPNSTNYVFDSNVSKLAIVRPLKAYKGTIPEESLNRINGLAGIRIEKLSSCKPYVTVNTGDEITFIFNILNANSTSKTINITDIVPVNTEFVSIIGGIEQDGAITFNLTVDPYESLSVSFTVKVKDNIVMENQKINSVSAKVNGVSIICHDISIRKTLTLSEQERIKEAIAYFVNNNQNNISGISLVNAIYKMAGLEAPFDLKATFKNVSSGIIGKSQETSNSKAVSILENGTYRSLVVDGLWGGRYFYSTQFAFLNGGNRIRLLREHNLIAGDVIIAKTSTAEKIYIYDGEYIYDISTSTIKIEQPEYRLDRFISYQYYFVVVRPSFS